MLDTPADRSHLCRTLYKRDPIKVECALDSLEGLAIALRIVRSGHDVLTDLEFGSDGYMSALLTQVDTVLDAVNKLSAAFRGEPLPGLFRPKVCAGVQF
jgi:hypothetical protein